jgi:hypothetical protein
VPRTLLATAAVTSHLFFNDKQLIFHSTNKYQVRRNRGE